MKYTTLYIALFFSLSAVWAQKDEGRALLEYEKNTIDVFKNTVRSVVNVSNIRKVRPGFFNIESTDIPAGQGSGFLWDNKGHIVTNYHVIQDGDKFTISFQEDSGQNAAKETRTSSLKDAKQYEAKLIGAYPLKDIAVLKLVEIPKNIFPITPGTSSSLEVGQKAMAIGSPFGLDYTITAGIISALERQIKGIGGVSIHGMIQTDSSINPGNSGGPLIDSSGKVIGMNTMIYSNSGSSAGVGFAVPIDIINRIVPELIAKGKVTRPGLNIEPGGAYARQQFGIKEGIIVVSVKPGGTADRAGIRGVEKDDYGRYYLGDIILSINDFKVNNFDEIFNALDKYKVGDEVTIHFVRNNKVHQVKVKLEAI